MTLNSDLFDDSKMPSLTDDHKMKIMSMQIVRQNLLNKIQASQLSIAKDSLELERTNTEFNKLLCAVVAELKVDVSTTSLNLETYQLVPKVK